MKIKDVLYLPSGRIFLLETDDGYLIESTEMRDVSVGGKHHAEVRKTTDPRVVWKHLVPFSDKWLLTVSTQKGCPYNCQFCDVATLPFKGNLSQAEIEKQVDILLRNTVYVGECGKAKIGFARMGEPAMNLDNVIGAMCNLQSISERTRRSFRWLPCFNSILPAGSQDAIDKVIETKERCFAGFLHFQISCNSTDEETRRELFGGARVMSVEDVVRYINNTDITNRTVTLNFIVMKGVEVDVRKLKAMGLNGDRFAVKLIPLNHTLNSDAHGLESLANYDNYEELQKLGQEFNTIGVPTVIDAIAKCEEAGLCCGQLAQIFRS